MAVKACLNGTRTRAEHPAVPQSPAELAADATAVRAAGAFAVHIHPRDGAGRETLRAAECDAAVAAIRAAAPRLPIGLSTGAWIEPDPFRRADLFRTWRQRPDFVSINVSELGWAGVIRGALHAGIAVEVGLSAPEEADELASSPFVHQVLRALVEVDGDPAQASAISARVPGDVSQLWHGSGAGTWAVIAAGGARGFDVRVGLEDTLVLPDGRTASGNAELVAAAVALSAAPG